MQGAAADYREENSGENCQPPRSPVIVLQLTTGSGSLADSSNVALTPLDVVAVQVKLNRAYLKANPVST